MVSGLATVFLLFLAMGLAFVILSWFVSKFIVRPIVDKQMAEFDARYPGCRDRWKNEVK